MSTCQPWAVPADFTDGPCKGDTIEQARLVEAIQIASDVLYSFTGSRWGGVCADVVRPDIAAWGGSWSTNVGVCGPQFGGCNCGPVGAWSGFGGFERRYERLRYRLPHAPVVAVTQVLIGGVTLPADRYRVDDDRYLILLPQPGDAVQIWPCWQDMIADTTETGTWQISYTAGALPPLGGAMACRALACELARSIDADDEECRLPRRIRTITRQGVSLAVLDPLTLFADGLTGLGEVDLWVASVTRAADRQRGAQILRPGRSTLRPHRTTV